MFAHYSRFFALSLCFATISFGAEPKECRPPQRLPQSAPEKSGNLSALDHLRIVWEQLEAAGLAEEAKKLRELSDQLNQRILRKRAELSRQMTALQQQSEQLRQLMGTPDKILCRCCILELSSEAAAEFAAAAEPVRSPTDLQKRTDSTVSVFKNAEEVIQQLKNSGKVSVVHASPHIVTALGQPATFKSGGEFPILIPAGADQTSVEWRPFGVFCKVEPRLLDTGKIQLLFSPEISHQDFTNAVKVNGLTVPGLTVRRVNTQAEMNLGETLVVRTVSSTGRQSKVVNAKSESPPEKKTVTLFMVTPVAFD
ncbi:outer membrane porin HofQ [Gimesia alba]|uniref:Outer membrane porin HofQ n=2 Tax=Gimesia alba TaxID=2527973 RepID=A0A517RID5_9PLAN|nr:outer membrane porin HofQ [Gimesia alba]